MNERSGLLRAMLIVGGVMATACTEAPATTSGSGGAPATASSTSSGGGSSSGGRGSSSGSSAGSSAGSSGGTTTGPLPLVVSGTIPGDSFSPMSALSAET